MANSRWSKDTRFFVDTCSLMEANAAITAWQFIVPTCRRHGIPPLIVTKSVHDELKRLATKKEKGKKAETAIKLVEDLRDSNFINFVGDDGDGIFADSVFISKFVEFWKKYQIVLFTQDRNLAKDVLSINKISSIRRTNHIEAFRVGKNGYPMRWKLSNKHITGVEYRQFDTRDGFEEIKRVSSVRVSMPYKPQNIKSPGSSRLNSSLLQPFELRRQVIRLDDTIIDTKIPEIGDTIKHSDGTVLQLTNSLGVGGEGTAFETNKSQFACKIYHRDHLKRSVIEKLELMISRTIHNKAICWPVSIACNDEGRAVGYIMPRATGRELKRSVFIQPLLKKYFPHWTRLHVVKLTATILDIVAHLHEVNVLLGDINPGNILVEDESTVYFVDCDSYQIEGFPCPVGMAPYLAPELYGKDLRSTLRGKYHEDFAIATLVFMLLHTGKPPYSHQGGEDPLKNVQKMHFPYPRGSQGHQNAPDGPWRYMFSHLPYYMKDAFHQVFSDGRRKSVNDWQSEIERYIYDLSKGHVSDKLYPRNFKRLTEEQAKKHGIPWRICYHCGEGFPSKGEENEPTCPDCFKKMRYNTNDAQSAHVSRSSKPAGRVHQRKGISNSKVQKMQAQPRDSTLAELRKVIRSLF